jgi:hypothetical protein
VSSRQVAVTCLRRCGDKISSLPKPSVDRANQRRQSGVGR